MLSTDLKNIAASVRAEIDKVNEGGRISPRILRVIAANIDSCADQAASLEGQMAPASPAPRNVEPLRTRARA